MWLSFFLFLFFFLSFFLRYMDGFDGSMVGDQGYSETMSYYDMEGGSGPGTPVVYMMPDGGLAQDLEVSVIDGITGEKLPAEIELTPGSIKSGNVGVGGGVTPGTDMGMDMGGGAMVWSKEYCSDFKQDCADASFDAIDAGMYTVRASVVTDK